MSSLVKQKFEEMGVQRSLGSAHMLPTMEHLCQHYHMQPTALVDHWQKAFALRPAELDGPS